MEQFQITSSMQRVNYDLIAHLYNEPGWDYKTDTKLVTFSMKRLSATFPVFRQRDLIEFLPVDQFMSLMQETDLCNLRATYKRVRMKRNMLFLKYASQRHRTSLLMAIPDNNAIEGISIFKEDVKRLDRGSRISSEDCLAWVTGDRPG